MSFDNAIKDHVERSENFLHEYLFCRRGTGPCSDWHFRLEIVIEFLILTFEILIKFTTRKSFVRGRGEEIQILRGRMSCNDFFQTSVLVPKPYQRFVDDGEKAVFRHQDVIWPARIVLDTFDSCRTFQPVQRIPSTFLPTPRSELTRGQVVLQHLKTHVKHDEFA